MLSAAPVARTASPILNVVTGDTACGSKAMVFRGGDPGIDDLQNAIDMLVNQRSAFPSENRPCQRVNEWFGG